MTLELAVAPAQLCTFKQLPPSAMIKIPTVPLNSPAIKDNMEDCMKMCYEDSSCVYVISFKIGRCMSSPSGGYSWPVNTVHYGNSLGGDVFQLDRNATDKECPELGEWLEERTRDLNGY
ncbi:hypothetical protein OSTOST_07497 [Ostertagia ostertagi]